MVTWRDEGGERNERDGVGWRVGEVKRCTPPSGKRRGEDSHVLSVREPIRVEERDGGWDKL